MKFIIYIFFLCFIYSNCFSQENISDIKKLKSKSSKDENIIILEIDNEGKSFVFPSEDSTDLTEEMIDYLSETAYFLKSHPDYKVIVTGHPEEIGLSKINKKRAVIRAENAADYLSKHGVKRIRIFAEGKTGTENLKKDKLHITQTLDRSIVIKIFEDKR